MMSRNSVFCFCFVMEKGSKYKVVVFKSTDETSSVFVTRP